jgi:hypothetical protein
VQKFVETLVVARKRTDENGGKPKMDAVLKRLGEAKAIFERGQQLCSKNGQLYLWLRGSRLNKADMVFVLSVGGGDAKKSISANLVGALDYAQAMRAVICGVVGRDGGYTAQVADAGVLVPVVNSLPLLPTPNPFKP